MCAKSTVTAAFDGYILGEVHINRRRYNSIVPRVGPVAQVERSSSTNVIDHALEEIDLPPFRFPDDGFGWWLSSSSVSTEALLALILISTASAERESRLPWLCALSGRS